MVVSGAENVESPGNVRSFPEEVQLAQPSLSLDESTIGDCYTAGRKPFHQHHGRLPASTPVDLDAVLDSFEEDSLYTSPEKAFAPPDVSQSGARHKSFHHRQGRLPSSTPVDLDAVLDSFEEDSLYTSPARAFAPPSVSQSGANLAFSDPPQMLRSHDININHEEDNVFRVRDFSLDSEKASNANGLSRWKEIEIDKEEENAYDEGDDETRDSLDKEVARVRALQGDSFPPGKELFPPSLQEQDEKLHLFEGSISSVSEGGSLRKEDEMNAEMDDESLLSLSLLVTEDLDIEDKDTLDLFNNGSHKAYPATQSPSRDEANPAMPGEGDDDPIARDADVDKNINTYLMQLSGEYSKDKVEVEVSSQVGPVDQREEETQEHDDNSDGSDNAARRRENPPTGSPSSSANSQMNGNDKVSSRASQISIASHIDSRTALENRVHDPKGDPRDDETGSSEGSISAENPWLFDAVSDTLGPHTISADLESLSGRSTRSNGSSRSHKSSNSEGMKPANSKQRRRRRSARKSSSSVLSDGNSHVSSRSGMPLGGSVASDILRLEMQLRSLGSADHARLSSASVQTTSTASVSTRSPMSSPARSFASSTTRSVSTTAVEKRELVAPPGKLGIILANRSDGRGTVVSEVRESSPLKGNILQGDRIITINEQDVSEKNVTQITSIMTRTLSQERRITLVTGKKLRNHLLLSAGSDLDSVVTAEY
eukprot:scaffold654921_cov118-Attheya_sp.AAC.1